jgi:hypothetical protein
MRQDIHKRIESGEIHWSKDQTELEGKLNKLRQ